MRPGLVGGTVKAMVAARPGSAAALLAGLTAVAACTSAEEAEPGTGLGAEAAAGQA